MAVGGVNAESTADFYTIGSPPELIVIQVLQRLFELWISFSTNENQQLYADLWEPLSELIKKLAVVTDILCGGVQH